ncbi:MAG: ATP-grasp domain-containing protein [Alphaproteobacteria bacterium]|nr:ATP-grasp domain-containing protein [Alphaproteobacteria bacterium]
MASDGGARRLLLLVPTTSYRVADFLDAAHSLGVEVAVGSNRRQVLEALAAGRTVTLDFHDLEKGVGQIVAYADEYPLKAIVAVDEEVTVLAAKASEALGLPHNAPDAVAAARNKYRMRTRLANSGLASPEFRLLSTGDDAERAARMSFYPCVLKPLALSASRGVIRADDPEAFVAAFHRIVKILERPDAGAGGDEARHILAEGYIAGTEVALEGLLEGGRLTPLALFDKPDPMEGPYFEETIYLTPSRLPADVQDAITAATQRAAAALGLEDGPVHAEMRIVDGVPWVVEIAARSIGGLCSRILRFGAGVTLEELILSHALGLPVPSKEREGRAAGVMMIPVPRAGKLRQVRGLSDARAVAGIEEVTISIAIGGELVPLPEGYKYLGFIFAKAETPEAAEQALRQAHGALLFDIGPL